MVHSSMHDGKKPTKTVRRAAQFALTKSKNKNAIIIVIRNLTRLARA